MNESFLNSKTILRVYPLIPFFLLSLGGACGDPAKPVQYRYVTARTGLRMRNSPDLKGQRLYLIPYRTRVTLIAERGGVKKIGGKTGKWARVRWNAREGWAFGGFLAQSPPTPEPLRFDRLHRKWIRVYADNDRWVVFNYSNAGPQTVSIIEHTERIAHIYLFHRQFAQSWRVLNVVRESPDQIILSCRPESGKGEIKIEFTYADPNRREMAYWKWPDGKWPDGKLGPYVRAADDGTNRVDYTRAMNSTDYPTVLRE